MNDYSLVYRKSERKEIQEAVENQVFDALPPATDADGMSFSGLTESSAGLPFSPRQSDLHPHGQDKGVWGRDRRP
jgi:hypothetical protein